MLLTRRQLAHPLFLPMKHKILLISAALLIGVTLATSPAQGVNEAWKISKISPEMYKTPDFSYSMGPTGKKVRAKDWLAVEAEFEWQPRPGSSPTKFTDEATFTYYILLNNRGQEFPQGTLLVGQVTHVAIPMEKGMNSVVYLSPRTLERFFDGKIPSNARSAIANVGVTITVRGQLVAANSLTDGNRPWWEQFQQTTGYVLNKNETPFAPLHWDYYEAIKPSRGGGL
jgi:hypothetical protein